ncbi:hypothetical protein BC939DRAFT_443230 [Gamsiella multidivaricata]|uniref:uncharacterized protein n=1 Tax=Gamsiella multidivaricata TaxID=101098 RepID=UPI00221EEE34|nr:uncharacterized protein BC939DRAFT_443230 [Gamsiella multidivaricata]KAG0354355.1 hypothetical protein BGZ54_001682 [Gamsiella multidivaricata]KAI7828552.1 hypothetical protein BC939DRAFT_443230 [Gamsiella multidivaricata]
MSFIFNIFSDNSVTPSEKENAAALKAIIKDHKTALKAENKRFEAEYKQAVKDAEVEYKRAKQEAKDDLIRKTLDAVKREVDIITATDEFANSDAKTKGKIEGFRSWMNSAEERHFGEKDEDLEVFEIFETEVDTKKNKD